MAWIYRAQNGDLMFSKTKPEKVYRFKFRNDQFHSDDEDVYCKQLSPEHIEVLWYPHEWLFVIYKIDDSDPEPYHVASKGCKSYWDCLEAGIMKALDFI